MAKLIKDDFVFLNGWGYVRKDSIVSICEQWNSKSTSKSKGYQLTMTFSNGLILIGLVNPLFDSATLAEPQINDDFEYEDLTYFTGALEWRTYLLPDVAKRADGSAVC